MIDPDELELLVEMILVEGFLGLPIWLGWTCWYASRLPLDQIESFSFTLIPRFRTCADLPGVEKLAVCSPDAAYLTAPYEPLPPLDLGSMLQCCIRSMIFVVSSHM